MAIKIIFGRGGSGKSFFQMHIIVEELRESRRNIVTNLAINVGEFNAYLENRYPDENLNLVGRLRILTEAETMEFWKHRGPIKWTGNEYDMVEDPGLYGTAFIIDEAGAAGFSAQGWAATEGRTTRGVACMWYLDQQRKFGDNVYASTNGRLPTNIAKGFRDKGHSFIRLKNGYQTTLGPFKARGRFTWQEFSQEPTGHGIEPIKTGKFEMGELAQCYRTQDGVGVTGNRADIGTKAKGIPILWVFPMFIGLGLLCIAVPWLLGKGAQSYMKKGQAQPVNHEAPAAGKKASFFPSSPSSAALVPLAKVHAPGSRPGLDFDPALYVVAYSVVGNSVRVRLSDGRLLTEADPELERVDMVNDFFWVSGQRLEWRPNDGWYPGRPVERVVPLLSPGDVNQAVAVAPQVAPGSG